MFKPHGIDLSTYHEALLSNHEVETKVSLLTLEHEVKATLTGIILSGQVNYTGESDDEVSRTCQLEILDPGFELNLDDESPDNGAVYANRMLQVEVTIITEDGERGSVVMFTGPLYRYSREGDVLKVEAQGKEMRARTDHATIRCGKHMRTVDAIERIMRKYGERKFAFPKGVKARLGKEVVVGREEDKYGWPVCQRLARSIGMQLFYDGRGVLVLRDIPKRSVFTFAAPQSLTTITHDWSTVFNRVEVRGKKKVKGKAQAPKKHPFSPQRLGAHGEPWRHTYFISDDKIGNKRQANRLARTELSKLLDQRMSVQFSHMPVYHLDPLDRVRVGNMRIPLRSASVPLGGGEMSVGVTSIASLGQGRGDRPGKGKKGRNGGRGKGRRG